MEGTLLANENKNQQSLYKIILDSRKKEWCPRVRCHNKKTHIAIMQDTPNQHPPINYISAARVI